jgi:hypothetical protein
MSTTGSSAFRQVDAGVSVFSLEQIGHCIDHVIMKLQKEVDNVEKAKQIVRSMRQLRKSYADSADEKTSDAVANLIYSTNICGYCMACHTKLLAYGFLADETFRCLLPILRQKSSCKDSIMNQLVEHGSAVFALMALRVFENDQNVCIQALELLSSSIEFICEGVVGVGEVDQVKKDVIHQLVLNGNNN